MPVRHYRAILVPAADGSCGVVFPELPGCISGGANADEAMRLAGEALSLHLGAMIEGGDPIPEPAPLDAPLPDWLGQEAGSRVRALVPAELPGKAQRLNISLDEGLVQRIDRAAEARGMTRSAFLAEGARRLLQEA